MLLERKKAMTVFFVMATVRNGSTDTVWGSLKLVSCLFPHCLNLFCSQCLLANQFKQISCLKESDKSLAAEVARLKTRVENSNNNVTQKSRASLPCDSSSVSLHLAPTLQPHGERSDKISTIATDTAQRFKIFFGTPELSNGSSSFARTSVRFLIQLLCLKRIMNTPAQSETAGIWINMIRTSLIPAHFWYLSTPSLTCTVYCQTGQTFLDLSLPGER